MDPAQYHDTVFGRAERTPGDKRAFWYYAPRPLPRDLVLEAPTIAALSRADTALGLLAGFGHLVRDPELLIGPYLRREALASTRIEGTRTTLDEVLKSEARGAASNEDTEEVWQYITAARLGMQLVQELPLTQRLIKLVHAELLKGVRGQERLPGEFRRSPVWVGSPTDTPDTAEYVPPLHAEISEHMADLEKFMNEPSPYPPLIQAGLLHYQFETIHPFLDGNGRIGLLLVSLFLIQEGRLPSPILYLSGHLESHRSEYYARLQAVRERGEVQEWLQLFLTAVERQAKDGAKRAQMLVQKREAYLAEAGTTRSRLSVVADLIFKNPIVTVATVQTATELTNQGARNLVRDAERRGWLTSVGSIGGRHYWMAQDVYEIIQKDLVTE